MRTRVNEIKGADRAPLARGAHGSMGFFLGMFLSSLGTLIMSLVSIVGGVFLPRLG